MGTNFYWRVESPTLPTGHQVEINIDTIDPSIHIGKRSAAGPYCYDCGTTLCRDGEAHVHDGPPVRHYANGHVVMSDYLERERERWHQTCPGCGKRSEDVGRACSFSWAQDPETVKRICRERPDDVLIEDEYGDTFTGAGFLAELDGCPIVFTHSIGAQFC